MTLDELRFLLRMVASGTEISKETWSRVLRHAIAVTKQLETEDDSDIATGIEFDASEFERPKP